MIRKKLDCQAVYQTLFFYSVVMHLQMEASLANGSRQRSRNADLWETQCFRRRAFSGDIDSQKRPSSLNVRSYPNPINCLQSLSNTILKVQFSTDVPLLCAKSRVTIKKGQKVLLSASSL